MSFAQSPRKPRHRPTGSPKPVSPRVLSWRHDNMPETLRVREEEESVAWWARNTDDGRDVKNIAAKLGLSPDGRWTHPADLEEPLDPFTSRYIHGKLDPLDQHVEGVTDSIQLARQRLHNTRRFLQQSKEKRDATVNKLRSIPRDPSDWFVDVCRRETAVALRRTFPEDDPCKEVKLEAKKRLLLQFVIDESAMPAKLTVKEMTLANSEEAYQLDTFESERCCSRNSHIQCSPSLDSTVPRSIPSSRSLLRSSSSQVSSIQSKSLAPHCDSSSSRETVATQKLRGTYFEVSEEPVVSSQADQKHKADAESSLSEPNQIPRHARGSSSGSQSTAGECTSLSLQLDSLHFSTTDTEQNTSRNAKTAEIATAASSASTVASDDTNLQTVSIGKVRTSKKAIVTETSDNRVCVKGHFMKSPDEEALPFTVFAFKDEGSDGEITLCGSYIRKMLTTDKNLRWRYNKTLDWSKLE